MYHKILAKTPLEFLRAAMREDNSPALNKVADIFLEAFDLKDKTHIKLTEDGKFSFVLQNAHVIEGEFRQDDDDFFQVLELKATTTTK